MKTLESQRLRQPLTRSRRMAPQRDDWSSLLLFEQGAPPPPPRSGREASAGIENERRSSTRSFASAPNRTAETPPALGSSSTSHNRRARASLELFEQRELLDHPWIGRMSNEQLEALLAEVEESDALDRLLEGLDGFGEQSA